MRFRLLPHAHDYDMKFPGSDLRWCFTCKCGRVVFTQQTALDEMYWTQLGRKIGIVIWGLGIAAAGMLIVTIASK
jgi:hypothetical protein